ncbi:MAG: hypothetical protein EPN45_12835 [Rhizobiaceae bacterium]|jgi:hypothetical protein|nr:MAG: hypothetical protein EPN45_12835 [Rhizobiaceae bacterium]
MLANLDLFWLVMAVAVVAIFSFIFGLALDGLMGGDGFGPIGNMVVVTGGFFLGIFLANFYGVRFYDLKVAVGAGLIGAFVSLGVLSFLKAQLGRM